MNKETYITTRFVGGSLIPSEVSNRHEKAALEPQASPSPVYKILIVEDNGVDEYLIREAIRSAELKIEPTTLLDGEQGIRYFEEFLVLI